MTSPLPDFEPRRDRRAHALAFTAGFCGAVSLGLLVLAGVLAIQGVL